LCLEGEPLTEEERQQILKSSGGLMMLRGKWVEVDSEKLQEALDHWSVVEADHVGGLNFIDAMRQLSGVALAEADEDSPERSWSAIKAGDWLSETLKQLRDPSEIDDCEPGQDLQATLRPYQADGVRWMWFMTRLGMGAILADDMGLGKTIQVIDLLLMLRRQLTRGKKAAKQKQMSTQPSLLVVPASLIGNWLSELDRFAPALSVTVVHRSECSAETMRTLKESPETELAGMDVVITTYGLIRRLDWLQEYQWNMVILDEAQAIKNARSAQGKAVRKLRAAGRIALSGTPIENHLGELWSLFDFCSPGLLGTAGEFKKYAKKVSDGQSATAYASLRKLIRPYILRRQKTDPNIAPDLPAKTEMQAECGLSKKQVVLYERVLKELKERLDSSEGIARSGVVLGTLMQLKQICNHPDQFLKQDEYDQKASGKFQRLATICQPIRERQERVLIFTQFQSLTQPLADFLGSVFGQSGLVLHGGVAVKRRKKLVAEFQADDGPPFFVISVKAGGTGLNLTAASHVIHFDRWWNPAVENQATDRAFRIGQKRNVLVHKFVCRGTVEEKIDAMLKAKQELADEILSEGAEKLLTEMSDDELLSFVAIDRTRAGHEE
ncbi:MAG: DEAD/DEAH box helicase, partial [Planctomycetaceae bacterium]